MKCCQLELLLTILFIHIIQLLPFFLEIVIIALLNLSLNEAIFLFHKSGSNLNIEKNVTQLPTLDSSFIIDVLIFFCYPFDLVIGRMNDLFIRMNHSGMRSLAIFFQGFHSSLYLNTDILKSIYNLIYFQKNKVKNSLKNSGIKIQRIVQMLKEKKTPTWAIIFVSVDRPSIQIAVTGYSTINIKR